MASLRRAAERSLRSIDDEAARAERLEQIAGARPLKRAGLQVIDGLMRNQPDRMAALLGIERHLPDMPLVDSGVQSTVYRLDEDTVLKVIEGSKFMAERAKRRQVEAMREQHATLAAFVGPSVVPHEVDIGAHPFLRHAGTVIRITQQYRDVEFMKLNVEPDEVPDLAGTLHESGDRHPGLLDEIRGMLEASRELYAAHGLAPDLIGKNNVGVERGSGSFVIIDSQPLVPADGPPQQAMAGYLDNLEAALALA